MACNGGSTTFANSGCITQADYIVARESFLRGRGTFNLSRQGTQAQKSAMAGPTMPPMAGISLGGILKGAGRIATGLIPGTLDDRIFDTLTGGGSEPTGPTQSIPGNFRPQGAGCDFPAVSIGGRCVDPTAALPGGRPVVGPQSSLQNHPKGLLAWLPEELTLQRLLPMQSPPKKSGAWMSQAW